MSWSYTLGLRTKDSCLVSKRRMLPLMGQVLVEEGDVVASSTIVARTFIIGKEKVLLNMTRILGLSKSSEVPPYMLKKVGDRVGKGEIIAYRRYTAFHFFEHEVVCRSPIAGIMEWFFEDGDLSIKSLEAVNIEAFIPGRVTEVAPNRSVVIETPAALVQGTFGVGGETQGELMLKSRSPHDMLSADAIGPEARGKILVGGSLVEGAALHKAVEMGVKGVIAGSVEYRALTELTGHEMGVAITGSEEVGLTLVVTEGFSRISMAEKTFTLLKRFDGKLACINGATQIRAGVIRPEIIIPRPELEVSKVSETEPEGELTPGTPIRIIKDPYFGVFGQVRNLRVEPFKVESEAQLRVLEVDLVDGRRVIVPRANVEVVEE
jgi:hypothetical protein